MAINGIHSALSGMSASQARMNVSADKVANINTNAGDAAGAVRTNAGPAYINDIGQTGRPSAVYAPPRPGAAQQPAATGANAAAEASRTANTDAAREMTNQLSARNAYGAAVGFARASDEMNQTLVNVVR